MEAKNEMQPKWHPIANKMLPGYKHIGEYPETLKKLTRIDVLCKKAGGSLRSRQIIAGVLVDLIND